MTPIEAPAERSEAAAAAEDSLLEFVRQAWPVIEPDTPFVQNWHHEALAAHLEAAARFEIQTLLINIPPGFSKSTLCAVLWPAWLWTLNPNMQCLFASYHERLSTRDSVRMRDLVESVWYRGHWGHRFRLKQDQNQKQRYGTDKGGFRIATTLGGFGTGEHVDVLAVDDPHNVVRVESRADIDAAVKWWDQVTSTRARDPSRFVRVCVMQRLSQYDLSAHILETEPGCCHLKVPMEYSPARSRVSSLGWRDPRRAEGELAWPERFDADAVRDLRARLGVAAAGQLQQEPAPPEGSIFQSDRFRYFAVEGDAGGINREPPAGVAVLRGPDGAERRLLLSECRWAQFFDTALRTGEENCWTACMTAAFGPDGELLFWDCTRARVPIPRQFDWLCQQAARFPWITRQCVESKASGEGLLQTGDFAGVPLVELHAAASKVERAGPLATFYERGRVWHRAGQPWLPDFEDELRLFPAGQYDDQVDVAAYAALDLLAHARRAPRVRSFASEDA